MAKSKRKHKKTSSAGKAPASAVPLAIAPIAPQASPQPTTPATPPPSPDDRARRRRVWYRPAAVIASTLLALALSELALRALDVQLPRQRSKRLLIRADVKPPRQWACYPANPHGGLQPLPDLAEGDWHLRTTMLPSEPLPLERLPETPYCVEYRTSRQGLRDREFSPEPSAGALRVACIGDSFVFGEGVAEEQTLPRQLEAMLEPRCELINGGRPGIGTAVEVQRLLEISTALNCRRALVVFIANDIELTPELNARQLYINDLINVRDEHLDRHRSGAWYTGSLRLVELLGGTLDGQRIHRGTLQWYRDMYDPTYNAHHLTQLHRHWETLARLPNCRVALVLYPLLEGLERGYPLQVVHDRVAASAREAGLPVLDLAPMFQGRATPSLWVQDCDHHPNAKAHELAAEAIAKWLMHEQPDFLREGR